ncbi:hypothetical protein DFH29DRAFT_313307 [Suillus ampliporus]|nr:hypothetical protein DFH29DRAFT_313307 [Suillus ampliporus]
MSCYSTLISTLVTLYAAQARSMYSRTHGEAFLTNNLLSLSSKPIANHLMHWTLHLFDYHISHVLSSDRGCSTLLHLFLCAIDNFSLHLLIYVQTSLSPRVIPICLASKTIDSYLCSLRFSSFTFRLLSIYPLGFV